MKQLIGAKCIIKWHSDGYTEDVYISFGEYNEDTGEDGYSISDCYIFGYSDDVAGIAEAYEHDFAVLHTELIYDGDI